MGNKKKKNFPVKADNDNKALVEAGKKKLIDLLIIIGLTVLLLGVYYYFVRMWNFKPAFIAALIIWAITCVTYWIYNKGFTAKGVTPEMLPDEWSREKKERFIEDGKIRMKKSRWMIFIIVPLSFLFIAEIVVTILLPTFLSSFGFGK